MLSSLVFHLFARKTAVFPHPLWITRQQLTPKGRFMLITMAF